jgi:hypothetical protein
MDLVELVDDDGLQQDEWSLTKPVIGEFGQLEIVGWSGRYKNHSKFYILKCSICSLDKELFGEGYFKNLKSNLTKGQISCGCGKTVWSKDQYTTLCSRKAEELDYTFLGFEDTWKGKNTGIIMFCHEHGMWNSGSINGLINSRAGCPECGMSRTAVAKTKPDDIMIQSFFASGRFHPETKFWRSERKNNHGWKVYWVLDCPECGEKGEATSKALQIGNRPCACSPRRHKECYINLVQDGDIVLAVKFGVANNSKERIKRQNDRSVYEVKQFAVYDFSSVESCKRAERECKSELVCGVIPKHEMPDGYTETTWVYNIDKIIEIYERNGGILNE